MSKHDPLCATTHRDPDWCAECDFIRDVRADEQERLSRGTSSD